jgi:hypothetical protein
VQAKAKKIHSGRRLGTAARDPSTLRMTKFARPVPNQSVVSRFGKGREPNAQLLRRQGRDALRGSPRFLAAQRTLARDDSPSQGLTATRFSLQAVVDPPNEQKPFVVVLVGGNEICCMSVARSVLSTCSVPSLAAT